MTPLALSPRRRVFVNLCAFGAGLTVLLAGAGCGGPAEVTVKSVLRGKVKADGKLIGVGAVTVYSGTSKISTHPVNPSGDYTIENLSAGEYNFTVTDTDVKSPYGPAVKLPAKYADPVQSGLKANVSLGEQQYDILLSTK